MNRHSRITLVWLGALASAGALAAPLPFSANLSGSSQIVEVIDAGPPVVRFQTAATGSGSFDLVSYTSEDIVNMSTGAGTGTNVFTAGSGDQLFSSFSVQIVPTGVPGSVNLFGHATFTGGSGIFGGATGSADFTGSAVFIDASTALASLAYDGSIALVPEPGSWALMVLGLAAGLPLMRRQRG